MMPHALHSDHRPLLVRWAMQHFKNEVWDAILNNDPGTLPDSSIEQIERNVLADAQALVSALPTDRLKDRRYINCLISETVSEVKDRLRKAAARQVWGRRRGIQS